MINSNAMAIYKCRNCGDKKELFSVPNGFKAMQVIMFDEKPPKEWGYLSLQKSTICNCDGITMGVADFIGVRFT